MYQKLGIDNLDTSCILHVVGASGESLGTSFELFSTGRVSLYYIDEVSYCLHQFQWVLIYVFEDDLCLWLVSVVSEFRGPSHVEPVVILIIVIPVLITIVPLVVSVILAV